MKFYTLSLAALFFATFNTQTTVTATNSFQIGVDGLSTNGPTTYVDPVQSCNNGQAFISGKCRTVQYIEGCITYKTQSTCDVCEPRYDKQSNGLCYLNKDKNITCCGAVAATGGCSNCTKGLFLTSSNSCTQSNIVGCISKDSKGSCTNCATGYKLNGGKCDPGINFCKDYLGSGNLVCLKCLPKYSLVHNLCIPDQILGCVEGQQKDNVCSACIQPFGLVDGKCKVDNCKVHNEWGCAACECGYYLKNDKTCQKYEKSCIRYQNGVCTDCKKLFTLNKTTNKCGINGCTQDNGKICVTCQEGYVLNNNGQCDLVGCSYAIEGLCRSCNRGYKLNSNGTCLLVDSSSITSTPTIAVDPVVAPKSSTSTIITEQINAHPSTSTSQVMPQQAQFTVDASLAPVYTIEPRAATTTTTTVPTSTTTSTTTVPTSTTTSTTTVPTSTTTSTTTVPTSTTTSTTTVPTSTTTSTTTVPTSTTPQLQAMPSQSQFTIDASMSPTYTTPTIISSA